MTIIDLARATNREIVAEYDKLHARGMAICDEMIADGAGHLTPSAMREDPEIHPLAREDNGIRFQLRRLRAEADLRYGEGWSAVSGLSDVLGPGYRRVRT